jgi:chromate transporter
VTEVETRRPPLPDFVRAFLLIGATSFGGGRSAYFQDALVTRRKWLTEAQFLEAVAVSQVLPGPNIGNLAAYLGARLHGRLGAFIAVLCLVLPGGLAILALGALYFEGLPASLTGPIGTGVGAAAAGLALAAAIRLRRGIEGASGYLVALATFLLFGPAGWPIHVVLALCLPPSLALAWRRR